MDTLADGGIEFDILAAGTPGHKTKKASPVARGNVYWQGTYNQTLPENRANSVRAYLINQAIDPTAITAIGFGKSNPVASNDTATGRQQNRRVEIIISGEIIGTQIGHGNEVPQQ